VGGAKWEVALKEADSQTSVEQKMPGEAEKRVHTPPKKKRRVWEKKVGVCHLKRKLLKRKRFSIKSSTKNECQQEGGEDGVFLGKEKGNQGNAKKAIPRS